MECNKDEAARAKSIAEAKLELKDFAAAKKYALEAQNLYPGLNGISQMLKTIDVYVSSEKMINGLVDWYGVLDIDPEADGESIKKQYRKLALMLHPDKNNSSGAHGAFQLISEAWGLLLDKARRSTYDLITGHKRLQPKDPTNLIRPIPSTGYPGGSCSHSGGPPNDTAGSCSHTGGPPNDTAGIPFTRSGGMSNNTGSPFTQPGFPPNHTGSPCTQPAYTKFAKRKPAAPKPRKKSAKTAPPSHKPSPSPANQAVESFWTMCGKCKVEYEYHNLFRYMTLLCPYCKTPFVASVIPRFVTNPRSPKPSPSVPTQQQQQSPFDDNNNNYYNYNYSRAQGAFGINGWKRM